LTGPPRLSIALLDNSLRKSCGRQTSGTAARVFEAVVLGSMGLTALNERGLLFGNIVVVISRLERVSRQLRQKFAGEKREKGKKRVPASWPGEHIFRAAGRARSPFGAHRVRRGNRRVALSPTHPLVCRGRRARRRRFISGVPFPNGTARPRPCVDPGTAPRKKGNIGAGRRPQAVIAGVAPHRRQAPQAAEKHSRPDDDVPPAGAAAK